MASKTIYCPVCHGKLNVYNSEYGWVICINCQGRGTIDVSTEEYNKIEEKRLQDSLEAKRKAEQDRIEAEIHAQQRSLAEKRRRLISERKEIKTIFVICLVGIAVGGFFGILRYDGGLFTGFFMQGLFILSSIGGLISFIQLLVSMAKGDE